MLALSRLASLNGKAIPAIFCLAFMMIALFPGVSLADPHGNRGRGHYEDSRHAYRDDDDGDEIEWRSGRERNRHGHHGHGYRHDDRYFQPVSYYGCGRDGRAYYYEGRYIVARGWCTPPPPVIRHTVRMPERPIYSTPTTQFLFVFD